jgi:adenylate cyclase
MVDPSEFKDKVVYVGSSAAGIEDLKATSMSARTPGVFLHASFASNFIENEFLVPSEESHTIMAVFFAVLLCVPAIFGMKAPWEKVSIPFVALVFWIGFCLYGITVNRVYEAIPPLAAILFSGSFSFGYLALTEGKEKRQVRKMFSQYVSPELLNIMTEHPEQFISASAGTKVNISILFSDIRNFTTFSEKTSPEKVVEMLNTHFSFMTDPITKNKGTVDKFIGDAVMAFWGAPVKIENHPQMAVVAALEMSRRVADVNMELNKKGILFEVRIGIGINTGDAVIGNIGSEKKLNYTVIGDAVNLAARLESITKNYAVPIVISEFTYEQLNGEFPCRVLDTVKVKGKDIPVKIYEPIDLSNQATRSGLIKQMEVTNAAFAKFEKGDYKGSLELYNSLEESEVRKIYVSRCKNALEGVKATGRQRP